MQGLHCTSLLEAGSTWVIGKKSFISFMISSSGVRHWGLFICW